MKKMKALSLLLALGLRAHAADLLIEKVNGYTPTNHDVHTFNAMLVRDGRILATGDATELRAQAKNAQIIDGKGATMLPGLIDAHGHVPDLGAERVQLDLRGLRSKQEALQKLQAYAKAQASLPWIIGRGWNQELWNNKQFPSAQDIDAVVGNKPVYLQRVDGHAAWVNSLAMQRSGINDGSSNPIGGAILRDLHNQPNGILIDNAMEVVLKAIAPADATQIEQRLRSATQYLASLGLTAVHDAGITLDELAVEEKLAAAGELPIRLYAMLLLNENSAERVLKQAPRAHLYGDFLDVRALKIIGDGALGSRGAALFDDYSDAPGQRGFLLTPAEQLQDWMLQADSKGWQVNVHAIGDKANHNVLDNYALMALKNGLNGRRHRIEHAQVLLTEDIPRLSDLGLVASMQPTHATSDMHMAPTRLGAGRLRGAYAWRQYLQNEIPIAAGSDFPVELPNPFLGLYAAVTRQDSEGKPEGGWHAEDAMTREEALRAFTLDAAYAAYNDDRSGSLSPGKWADFILIDRDYFEVSEKEIAQIKVLQTWVAGKRVY